LGGLNLHGRLSVKEVQNIVNPLDALEANLKNKHHVKLELTWKSDHIPDDTSKEKKILENLQPSKQLEGLSIRSYCGSQFLSWIFDNSLSNLVFLRLDDCEYCLCLPPLGLLSSLKTLKIRGLDGTVSIGAEFYGSNSSSFLSLETLEFYKMKEWEEWECKTTSFPRLQHLSLDECPKLKGLSEQLLLLKELVIGYCDKLIISDNTSSLEILRINACPLVNIRITYYDFLNVMEIVGGCESLTIFPLDFFLKLRSLNLRSCQNLRRISQQQIHNQLKELAIDDCPQFESFSNMQILLPCLTMLLIIDCPEVEMFPDGGLPSNVKELFLSSLKLIAFLRETLGANTCLERLCIVKVDVECFPDQVLLPSSLTSLEIDGCRNLKKMEYKGLCHLSSLELYDCPNLERLPEEGLPKSISSLTIWNCPLLQQRCQNPQGEDWGKIAHIQQLDIR